MTQEDPLCPLPVIQEALYMDIVGPVPHPAQRGKKYILVGVDFATRSPEAVA